MEVVKQRRSIRKYKSDPVPESLLDQILEATRLAPSGANRQLWHFIVVKDPQKKKMLDISDWAKEAPIVVVGCTEDALPTNIAIALEHLVLAATNFGLGTCWMGRWSRDNKIIKETLSIPENINVLAIIALGYSDELPIPKPRKSLSEIVHKEKF